MQPLTFGGDYQGMPWFLATDVCQLLGYKVSGSGVKHYLLGLRKDADRKTFNTRTLGIFEGIVGTKGNPLRTFITEAGLYTVIMRAHSTRDGVEEFQTWVTKVVLPAIRKDGGYVMGEEKVASGEITAAEVEANLWRMFAKKVEAIAYWLRGLSSDSEVNWTDSDLLKNTERP